MGWDITLFNLLCVSNQSVKLELVDLETQNTKRGLRNYQQMDLKRIRAGP